MRLVQILAGAVIAVFILWLGITQYMGRQIYAPVPALLTQLPWSDDANNPARVATASLVKPCGELRTNEDLLACLRMNGLKIGSSDGSQWATYETNVGFSAEVYRLSWPSGNGALPKQIYATKQ